jgi:membrane-associated phospholipid phosphatase
MLEPTPPSHQPAEGDITERRSSLSRRQLLGRVGGAAATYGVAGTIGTVLTSSASADAIGPKDAIARRRLARALREESAARQSLKDLAVQECNGDESRFADLRGQYSKGLPHDPVTGEVDSGAYQALLSALRSGAFTDFEAIPMGGARKLVSPLGFLAYDMVGPDSHHLSIPAAPTFDSAWQAGEMVEGYWKALLRDVRFEDFETDSHVVAASVELSRLSDFRGPKEAGFVTPRTLLRGFTAGDLIGPYVSQFLWRDVPYGMTVVKQAYQMIADGDDRITTFDDWLQVQNGNVPGSATNAPGDTRYITSGRDLAQYVHFDFSFQAYLNAALILLPLGGDALAGNNPYKTSATQAAFVNMGGPEILDMVTKAGNCALKAAWYQKWGVHRRLRPEAFSGRVHQTMTGVKDYALHPELLNSKAVTFTFNQSGTYLQSQAYPEGSPTHCSYPAGHAVVAGACVTILKAFFDGNYLLPNPVVPTADGQALVPYAGPPLTLGNELDKLASNISIGRNIAGVHWRTDGDEGMRLGEQLAIGILEDFRNTRPEIVAPFQFRGFDGQNVVI